MSKHSPHKPDSGTVAVTDTDRMDWLERNLLSLSHDRATCSVDMSGRCCAKSYRKRCEGTAEAVTFRVKHKSVRGAIDAAMGVSPA